MNALDQLAAAERPAINFDYNRRSIASNCYRRVDVDFTDSPEGINELEMIERDAVEAERRDHDFRQELESAINRCCMENRSNTPDFILAVYLQRCLAAFDEATIGRDKWYGIAATGTSATIKTR